ncbi:MAG: hypothetical protein U5Q16_00760 [Gammaproteobacteria bacterium]|nr:hypothetical protein [Gammaproteobacteria bacterium]
MACGALVLALLAFYLVPDLVTRGLALDGLVYASIAQQLAQGAGGFWALPHYDGSPGAFLEHPPLGIWLLAQWMRLVGDAFWAEKAYAGLCTLACFGLTGLLWRGSHRGRLYAVVALAAACRHARGGLRAGRTTIWSPPWCWQPCWRCGRAGG